jgi:hypothetical protein
MDLERQSTPPTKRFGGCTSWFLCHCVRDRDTKSPEILASYVSGSQGVR